MTDPSTADESVGDSFCTLSNSVCHPFKTTTNVHSSIYSETTTYTITHSCRTEALHAICHSLATEKGSNVYPCSAHCRIPVTGNINESAKHSQSKRGRDGFSVD